jgi:hypothetical protein
MTPDQFIQWLDKSVEEAEFWKETGDNPDKTYWNTTISILSEVKKKFLTVEYNQVTFHNPDNPEPDKNFTDGLD